MERSESSVRELIDTEENREKEREKGQFWLTARAIDARVPTNMRYKHGERAVFLPLVLLFPLINVHKLIWLLSQYRKHPPER